MSDKFKVTGMIGERKQSTSERKTQSMPSPLRAARVKDRAVITAGLWWNRQKDYGLIIWFSYEFKIGGFLLPVKGKKKKKKTHKKTQPKQQQPFPHLAHPLLPSNPPQKKKKKKADTVSSSY